MRRQIWLRFSAAMLLVALLAPALAASSFNRAGAFQTATPAASAPAATPAVQQPVETADQVFVSGTWRIEIVLAQQAFSFPDFKLSKAAGKSWLVVVADVANFSTNDASLDPYGFGVQAAGASEIVSLAPSSSKRIAKQLNLQPTDPDVAIVVASGVSERLILAFQVDATGRDYSLVFGESMMTLATSIAQARTFDALPEPAPPPDLTPETFSAAASGSSVKLKSGTVALAGVDAPLGNECYSGEATARIKKLVKGKSLLSERAGSDSIYLWIEQSDGTRMLLNVSLIGGGYAAAASGLTGAYASWLTAAEANARAAGAGLWGACTNQHGQPRPDNATTSAIAADSNGKTRSYVAWIAYPPKIVTTPDGGAWIFYSAQPTSGADAAGERLFASHYDPTTAKWSDGTEMPGGQFQMGASTAVDSGGLVHLVYSDQAKPDSYAVLMYTHEDGAGGWTTPIAVAANPQAGHQLNPSLAIDKNDVLHVAWQDQRVFSAQARSDNASNADILVSDFKPGSTEWSKPFLVNTHFFDSVSLLPHLVVDGDRLVLVWSFYDQTLGLSKAARIDWATRPLDKALAWTLGQPLVTGRGDGFGGRLVDVAADPTGGVVMAFVRQANDSFLFLRRLKPGAAEWGGDILIAFGARGNYPAVTVAEDGTVYIAYEAVAGANVKVAAVAIPYRSVVPGPETVLTTSEANSQGRPGVATDLTSNPWLVYIAESSNGKSNKVEALRNASTPLTVPSKK